MANRYAAAGSESSQAENYDFHGADQGLTFLAQE